MKVLRTLLVTLIGLVAVAGLTFFLVSALGLVRFVPVLSNSMAPEMPVGSLAVTLPVSQSDVRAGDVIVFTDPFDQSRRVIHRVTLVYPEDANLRDRKPGQLALATKGDNNATADPWIVTIADQRIWREGSVVPALGWPAIALAHPEVRFALFATGGAGLVGAILAGVWRRPAKVSL